MSDPEPVPAQQPTQPIPEKRKWWQLSDQTKNTIWEIKWLICTFLAMALTQILQPLLSEIMESNLKAVWKTYSAILLPSLIITGVGIIMKVAQGKSANHVPAQQQPTGMQSQMGLQQYQQLPQQYAQQGMGYVQQGAQYGQGLINQGATMGTNLINQGTTQLTGAIQTGVQAIPQVPQTQPVLQPAPAQTQPVAQPTPAPTTTTTPTEIEPTE